MLTPITLAADGVLLLLGVPLVAVYLIAVSHGSGSFRWR